MEPKLINKKVGKVQIFEIFGQLQGNIAPQVQVAIYEAFRESSNDAAFFNFEKLFQIDLYGARVIVQGSRIAKRSCILVRDPLMREIVAQEDPEEKVFKAKAIEDAANFLSHEFAEVEEKGPVASESRRFRRLKTALPMRFSFEESKDAAGQDLFAVVTNLSEGGLFAEFIQSGCEQNFLGMQERVALGRLRMDVWFDPGHSLSLNGNAIHAQESTRGVGIEFCEMAEKQRKQILDWLNERILVG